MKPKVTDFYTPKDKMANDAVLNCSIHNARTQSVMNKLTYTHRDTQTPNNCESAMTEKYGETVIITPQANAHTSTSPNW